MHMHPFVKGARHVFIQNHIKLFRYRTKTKKKGKSKSKVKLPFKQAVEYHNLRKASRDCVESN